MARSSHGRKPKFKDAETLLSACLEYFEWVEKNPLYEIKPFFNSKTARVIQAKIPKMRAMTIEGLCIFLDINQQTWHNYADRGNDFVGVITRVVDVIRTQKFEGAASEFFNANIIARDLGLKDKREIELGGDLAQRMISARQRIRKERSVPKQKSPTPKKTRAKKK